MSLKRRIELDLERVLDNMRILYVIYSDFEDTKFFGVKKKIINQIKALNRLNNTVVLAYCHNGYFILYQNEEIIKNPCRKRIFKI